MRQQRARAMSQWPALQRYIFVQGCGPEVVLVGQGEKNLPMVYIFDFHKFQPMTVGKE